MSTDSKPGDPMTGLAKAAGANVVQIPPPLYYGAALAGGLILQRFLPLDIPFRSATAPAGAVALALGIALNLGGVIGVAPHKTTIVPHHHVTALVTTGSTDSRAIRCIPDSPWRSLAPPLSSVAGGR